MVESNEDIERGTWTGRLDFMLSCIGYAVGLGNVWRFPYLAYKNGGASFLFPYIIMLIIAGLPLIFFELALGQFTSEGPITVWRMAPFFSGIGVAMVVASGMVSIYYNMIIAYAIYYMWVAFVNLDDDLPWKKCDPDWATAMCRDKPFPDLDRLNETEKMKTFWDDLFNKSCVWKNFDATVMQNTHKKYENVTDFDNLTIPMIKSYKKFSDCEYSWVSPAEEYFERFVLQQHKSEDIGDLGDVSLKICLTLALAWLLVFFCLMKGVKSSGKVVYFTATFPYVVLIVLLIRGLTLDGHEDGVEFYVVPEWDKLTEAKIWGDAATQIFYSLGVGFGGIITMSSYNKFHNNCYRDAIIVSCVNCGTSIFAGFAIFSLLGYMAHFTNQEVSEVATAGPGLAFVAYPYGITKLPASSLFAFLFFFMILTLGLDSQFGMMETIISGISDMFPRYLRRVKTPFTFICCLIGFLLGIPQATHGGIRVLTLMNDYTGSYNIMVIGLAEVICLCYVYGISNFRSDIEMMVGFKPNIYWVANWMVITPIAVIFIIVVSAIQYETSGYDGQTFPGWAEGLGWMMVAAPLVAMVITAIVQLIRYGYPGAFKPTKDWGPALPEDRTGRYAAINYAYNDEGELPYIIDKDKKVQLPSYNNAFDQGNETSIRL